MMQVKMLKHTGCVKNYGEISLVDCNICGFTHVFPMPVEVELEKLYKEQFYTVDKPQYINKMEEESKYWETCVYKQRYEVFETNVDGRYILDIGCSGGWFLKYGKDRGWSVLGIEPAKQAAEYAREINGISVLQKCWDKVPIKGNCYDVVHIAQVLEHVPDPAALIEWSWFLLKPDGLLCVEVPNDFNVLQDLACKSLNVKEYWVSVPHHLNYFNKGSLNRLLLKTGFNPIRWEASFPMEMFLLMTDNYIFNEEVGQLCHKKLMNMEYLLDTTPELSNLRQKFYAFFAENGIGRTVIVYCRKGETHD